MPKAKPRRDAPAAYPSPWPFLAALGLFLTLLGAAMWMNTGFSLFGIPPFVRSWICLVGMVTTGLTLAGWARDMIAEAAGAHKPGPLTSLSFRYAMLLLLMAEAVLFVVLAWAYGDAVWFRAEAPAWSPPDPFRLPLLASLLALMSVSAAIWAQRAGRRGERVETAQATAVTALLALIFTMLVLFLKAHLPFATGFDGAHLARLADPAHAELTFVFGDLGAITGSLFHLWLAFFSFHAIVGSLLLVVAAGRAAAGHFTFHRHFGLTAALWYWYFGVGVWLILYITLYVVGYAGPAGR